MTHEEAKALIAKHGSQRTAAKAAGVARKTIRKALSDSAQKATHAPKAGRALADFRATFDKAYIVPQKIKAALGVLGKSAWEYEVDFAKMAGVSMADLGRFRDQFADYVVTVNRESRRAWAGSTATARAMREML
jgi:hypothetical protein